LETFFRSVQAVMVTGLCAANAIPKLCAQFLLQNYLLCYCDVSA